MSDLIGLIKQLRDRTGAGLMDCKRALVENGEDIEKAALWLREKGIAKQEKKASRTAAEGVAWVMTSGDKAAVIEINCETDFVANSDPFRDLVKKVNEIVLAKAPSDKETAMECVDKDGKTIHDLFIDAGIKLGEKLDFRRFALVTKTPDEVFAPYVHMNGKIATLAVVKGEKANDVATGIALNICNDNPTYITEADIPADVIAKETAIEKEASLNDPSFAKKPANIQEKIIEGRVKKNLGSSVLTNQVYILDQDKTVGQVLKETNTSVVTFVRYAVGEGIEKKQEDFAAEVASQIK